jgi:hypothetical protein
VRDGLVNAQLRMIVVHDDAARLDLRLVHDVGYSVHRGARNADLLELRQPLGPRARRNDILNDFDRDFEMSDAISVGCEARVREKIVASRELAEALPVIVVRDPQEYEIVGRLEDLIGTERLVTRPGFRR